MRTRPSLDSALRGLLATQSSGATTPPQTCGQERKKLAEHSSGKTAVDGLCGKMCLVKHIQLFSHSRTWIHRPYRVSYRVPFLDIFTELNYNELTIKLHRHVWFPYGVFRDGIFTLFSRMTAPLIFNTLQPISSIKGPLLPLYHVQTVTWNASAIWTLDWMKLILFGN